MIVLKKVVITKLDEHACSDYTVDDWYSQVITDVTADPEATVYLSTSIQFSKLRYEARLKNINCFDFEWDGEIWSLTECCQVHRVIDGKQVFDWPDDLFHHLIDYMYTIMTGKEEKPS